MSKVILLAPTPPPIGGIAAWTVRMMSATLPNDWKVEVVDEKIIGKREFFGDKTKHDLKSEIKRCDGIGSGLGKALKDEEAKGVHACIAANTMPVLREYISACITKIRGRKFIIHFRCTVPNIVGGRLNNIALKLLCNKFRRCFVRIKGCLQNFQHRFLCLVYRFQHLCVLRLYLNMTHL